MSGTVHTVLGEVSPDRLGRTLTHEHLYMDFTHFYREPPSHIEDKFGQAITLDTLGYLRQYPYSSKINLVLNDELSRLAVEKDVAEYKKFGGGTIVENSTEGLKRNVNFLKKVSQETGVHIVAGTGFYIADMQIDKFSHSAKEELYNHMLKELSEGCVDAPDVRAGFMGEIASVWPIRDLERKAIIAAGELQEQVKCGVSFHPHRTPEAPFEIIRLYLEAGGRADRAVMSHLDRTLLQDEKLLEFAELGTYCQLDLFGVEVSYYQLSSEIAMPSDARRIAVVARLVADGRADRVLISHDIHTKHRLTQFGGHGYSHIINNILPRMSSNGVSQETIDKITIENPARWLTITS